MKTKHKRWFWALMVALIFSSISLLVLASENQSSKDTIAVVNGSVITQEELDREIDRIRQEFLSKGKSLNDSQIPKIKEEVLESLIDFELLYQESQNKAIKIEKGTIDEYIMKMKKQFPTEAEFKNTLTTLNLTETTLKAQIKRRLAIEQFISTYLAKNTTVSDQEIKDFYEKDPTLFKQPEQVRASHILIKIDPQANESQKATSKKKMQEIQNKLKNGEDFAALAKEFSQCPSSAKNGDLGYFGRGNMVKPFEEVSFALKTGEVSDIVETQFGYHLIKVTDKKPESTLPFENIKDRLGKYLKQNKVQKDVKLYVQKLKEKANVERFLAENP
jgi:peptidyl-prolyl cis-trans isomerase C